MAHPVAAAKSRRLRWALLLALALHIALLWRVAPRWFSGAESASAVTLAVPLQEQVVEILPPPLPPKPKSHGMALATRLGEGSPERLQAQLPEGFFARNKPLGQGTLQLAGGLDFSRASGLQIVANIVPAAVSLPGSSILSDRARLQRLRAPAATAAFTRLAVPATLTADQPARPAAPLLPIDLFADAPGARAVLAEPLSVDSAPPPSTADQAPTPFLLPPVAPGYDVDATISRAADAAEQSARQANAAAQARPAPDYRQLLPQGPLVAAPTPPALGGKSGVGSGAVADPGLGEPVEPTLLREARRSAEQNRLTAATRQQFFAEVTAQLKASNVRVLAAAIKAGPKATVQMQFTVDRDGRITDLRAIDNSDRTLVERAMATLRAAALPRLPDAMNEGPVELSFPVEVYR